MPVIIISDSFASSTIFANKIIYENFMVISNQLNFEFAFLRKQTPKFNNFDRTVWIKLLSLIWLHKHSGVSQLFDQLCIETNVRIRECWAKLIERDWM